MYDSPPLVKKQLWNTTATHTLIIAGTKALRIIRIHIVADILNTSMVQGTVNLGTTVIGTFNVLAPIDAWLIFEAPGYEGDSGDDLTITDLSVTAAQNWTSEVHYYIDSVT